MKLMYLVLLVFFVNVALVMTGVSGGTVNALFDFMQNPFNWNDNPWSTNLAGVLAAAGVGIIVGAMVFRNENLLWYGVAAAFLSFGSPLVDLFNYVKDSIGSTAGTYAAYILVSPMILAYIFIIIYWARGRD
jgi:hypothetical protein